MRTALRVTAGMDDSQSVELRDRCGMAMTVSARQQCWIAPAGRAMTSQAEIAHFVGWVERSETHHLAASMMGIAALHPSYKRAHSKSENGERANSDRPIAFVFNAFQTQSGHRATS